MDRLGFAERHAVPPCTSKSPRGGRRTSGFVAGRVAAVVGVAFAVAACGGAPSPPPASSSSQQAPAGDWFVERAREVGLAFTHTNGMSGRLYDAEIFGPGVALFDYDNDGDLDVYAVQGRALDPGVPPSATGDRLFRNDLEPGGDPQALRFTDVTAASHIDVRSYGMGVAAGDYDNDGWVDLYLLRLGPNVMLHNNGDGTFSDVTRPTGTGDPSWSVSASFVDVDRDGWLDLYVANYLQYDVRRDVECRGRTGVRDYCDPRVYPPARARLYRNRGDGTFVDVTGTVLVGGGNGPGLGVATADLDGDGWIDIYVTNDGRENDLWTNGRDGTLRNTALLAGVALNGEGRAEASMGVDAGDADNDGDEDLVITNLDTEGHTLYRNRGGALFDDWGSQSGLRQASLGFTGFGAAWLDVDHDGLLDLLTVNGAVRGIERLVGAGDPFPLHQTKQLFRNLGDARFEEVTARAGAAFTASDVGRGAAFGDLDNDGDTDVVVANNNGPMQLLLNEVGNRRHWLGLRLLGARTQRDMVGSRVRVVSSGQATIWRRSRADGSYASASDPRVLVGLGESGGPASVQVLWADGGVEEWTDLPVDRWTTLRQGTGK